MATKISLTIPRDLTEQEQRELRTTLMDALHEFTTRRSPPACYVADRYVGTMSPPEAMEKIKQVERRVVLGKALWAAMFDATVTLHGHTNHALCATACGPACVRPEGKS